MHNAPIFISKINGSKKTGLQQKIGDAYHLTPKEAQEIIHDNDGSYLYGLGR
jgi:hypothetical protein